MKTRFSPLLRSASTIALACVVLAPMQSFAQEEPPLEEESTLETVTVTGSRLANRGFEAPTPVNVIGREEYTLSGTESPENLLLYTPQFGGNQLEGPTANTAQAGQPLGTSTLNLRNFGATRNLVLVNGRRFTISGPALTTDINTIPAALIEQTEVVTGGSSAVYGSDAITGVVNFIMRDDFEGVELNAQVSADEHTSSPTYTYDLTFGGNLDNGRGNVVASLGYQDRTAIGIKERGGWAYPSRDSGCVTADSYSETQRGVPLSVPSGLSCVEAGGRMGWIQGGSSAVPNGRIGNLPTFGSGDAEWDAALVAAGLQDMTSLGAIFDDAGMSVRPFSDPADRFDFGDTSYLVTPQKRWMGNVFGHYDINDKMTGYMELHYSNNVSEMQIAPTNITGNLLVDVDNPYVSEDVRNLFRLLDERETGTTTVTQGLATMTTTPNDGIAVINYNRRFSDLPPRNAQGDHSTFRTAVGVRGDLGDFSDSMFREMSYDVYYTYARTSESQLQIGSVSKSAVLQNLLSVNGADHVLNLFGQNISEAGADAILISSNSKIVAEQEGMAAAITGVAFDMPAGPVDFALGTEWRSSESSYVPDRFLSSGDVSGWNSANPTSGSSSVAEVFGEIRAPIVADAPGFERLSVNGAFRYSDYDLEGVGGVWTYSTGAEWAPTTDLTLRGQFQHAIRAPNVGELFGGRGSDGPIAQDPCSSMQPVDQQTAAVRDICIATGVPAGSVFDVTVQPSPFVQQIRGGNPDLDTEKSDTTTLGLVYQPSWIDGLGISVDYFSIELEDAIATLGGGGVQNVLDLCYNVLQDASSVYCQAINRDPTTGEISGPDYVLTTYANIGGLKTSGVDFEAQYSFQTDWGLFGPSDWRFGTNWTYTDEFTITPIQELPDITNECVGAWGGTCGQPIPELKGVTRLTWNTGPATMSLAARYIGEVTTDRIIVPQRKGESHPDYADISNPTIDRTVYFDLSGSYQLLEGTRLTAGVRNLMDEDPEIGAPVQTYDPLGRSFFLSVNTKF